jgi:hypothetical protein
MNAFISRMGLSAAVLAAACSTGSSEGIVATGVGGHDNPGSTGGEVGGASNAGGGGAAPCDPAADHSSDPKNCGACGHDCLGGACTGGACQPVAIGAGTDESPALLFVDDTYVYWTNHVQTSEHMCPQVKLVRTPKQATNPPAEPQTVASENGVYYAGVGPEYIYYGASRCAVDDGHIRRFPVNSANTPTPETVATLPVGGMGVAAAGDSFFFLAATASGPINVVATPAGGGAGTTLATDPSFANFLLTDGANLYWNSGSANVTSVPVTGGDMVAVASAQDLASDSVGLGAVDGVNVYFLDDAGLHALPVGQTGAGTVLFHPQMGTISHVVSAGDDVCMVTNPNPLAVADSISCVAKDGGPNQTPRVVVPAAAQGEFVALAADDSAIYWIDSITASTIYSLAK